MAAALVLLLPHGVWAQQNPLQSLTDALNKAKQQLQQSTHSTAATPAAAPAASSTSTTVANTSASASTAPEGPATATPTVFTAPASAAAAAKPTGPLNPSKLMDIGGVHIGVSIADTVPILKKLHADVAPQAQTAGRGEPMSSYRVSWSTQHPPPSDDLWVNYTFDTLSVYSVFRTVGYEPQISKTALIEALRKKYGPETAAMNGYYLPKNDNEITSMWWLSDEQGAVVHPANLSKNGFTPYGCTGWASYGYDVVGNYRTSYRQVQDGKLPPETFCDSTIILTVSLDNGSSAGRADPSLVVTSRTGVFDNALLRRSIIAWAAHLNGQAQQQQQQVLQKANTAKPNL
jgi:hypothetical protein